MPLPNRTAPVSCRALAVFTLLVGLFFPASVSAQDSWVDNDDMLLFYEALVKIREQSIHPEQPKDMVRKAIRGYLQQLDAFSDYLTPEEYAAWKQARQGGYAGVGMDIFADPYGRIICLPFPGGPAYQAGVRYGDVLTFVGRRSVRGTAVRVVGSWIRGRPGGSVSITVSKPGGGVRGYTLSRRMVDFNEVALDQSGPLPRIRIYSFASQTAEKLQNILQRLPKDQPRVLDLRGNTGGDLFAAMDAAAFFLPQGAVIVDIRSQGGAKRYSATNAPMDSAPLFVWQDALTASAAEVFLAALVENGRATSMGQTSFGKGVTQTMVELSDGSVMFVTNGALRTPGGAYYHTKGIEPMRELELPLDAPDTAFWNATLERSN